MNRIDLAVSGVEPSLQPGFKPVRPPDGEASGKLDFKSVLAGKSRKTVFGRRTQAKPVITAPDSGEPLPEQNKDSDLGEPAALFPVNPEEPPGLEDEQFPDPGKVAPLPVADCAGEFFPPPGRLPEPALFTGTGRHQPAALPALNDESSPLIFPEPAFWQEGELIEAGPGTGRFEPELEIAGQTAARSALIEKALFPEEALFIGRAVHRPPGVEPGMRLDASGGLKEQNLPQAGVELDVRSEGAPGLLYGSVKIKDADSRSVSTAQDRVENREAFIAAPASPEVELPADPAGPERFLSAQLPVENTAARESIFTLPDTGSAATEQGPDMTNLPNLTGSVLDQLRGSCAYFRERVDLPAEIRLALNPPELGEVLIRVVSRQGKLSAKIIAEVAAVKEMLASNLHELHQRFEQNNLHLDRIDLLTAGEMSLDDHRFKKGDYRGLWANEGSSKAVVHEEDELRLERVSEPVYDGAINYWA